ncbi:MAG: Glucose-6-phosphate isomerase [Chlamydiae bacterium]|nr:Glucose-6-phosphate isomerase [Chlamydiota bacterium]
MTIFNQYASVNELRKLAQKPFDLTNPQSFNPDRVNQFFVDNEHFRLLFATEQVDDNVLDHLIKLSEEANVFDKMQAMQSGEVLNFIEGFESENRSVLHTAMRDFFEDQNQSEKAKAATKEALVENQKLEAFIKDNEEHEKFIHLVVVGIGGSELGAKALTVAMQHLNKPNRTLHFVSNVDPDNAASVAQSIDLSKTLVASISKSGGTLETLTNEALMRHHFEKKGLDPKGHFIVVTGKGSPLDDPERYLERFYMWDFIGGRYSVTSMVGGIPLAFCLGYDQYKEILRGANYMDKHALNTRDPKKNLPLMSALLGIWNRTFLNHHTVAIIPYSQALGRFAAHLQQLDMESNGKRIDKKGNAVDFDTGPIIWGEPGTNAQHSFFQMLHQGTTPVPIEFISFKESQYGDDLEVQGTLSHEKLLSNMFAQSMALANGHKNDNPNKNFPGNRPSRVLLGKKLDPFTLGALLAYYEHKVAFQGFIWNINSFDQEGVQLGKVLANQMIDLFAKKRGKESKDYKDVPVGDAYLKHLESLK